jgi:hypothetical protein
MNEAIELYFARLGDGRQIVFLLSVLGSSRNWQIVAKSFRTKLRLLPLICAITVVRSIPKK